MPKFLATSALVSLLLVAVLASAPAHAASPEAKRGYGGLTNAGMLKRPNAPPSKRYVLHVFTLNASGHNVFVSKGHRTVQARFYERDGIYDEWRIKMKASPDARRLVRRLANAIRRRGKVKFSGWTVDPAFPKPSLGYTCKITHFNDPVVDNRCHA